MFRKETRLDRYRGLRGLGVLVRGGLLDGVSHPKVLSGTQVGFGQQRTKDPPPPCASISHAQAPRGGGGAVTYRKRTMMYVCDGQ